MGSAGGGPGRDHPALHRADHGAPVLAGEPCAGLRLGRLRTRDGPARAARLGRVRAAFWRKRARALLLPGVGRGKRTPFWLQRLRARDLLQRYGLGDWVHKRCETLSKGMGQKVQLLATLIHNPDLVILDEPFSGLDPVNLELMRNVILQMKEEGKTVIFSTHVMEQAEQICDYILMINKGKIVLNGTLADVRSTGDQGILLDYDGNSQVLRTLPGIRRINDSGKQAELFMEEGANPQEILSALVGKMTIRRFDLREPSLHEIFIRTVGGESYE